MRELTPAMLAKFTRLDYERDMAFIAVREATGETVGVARLAREADRPGQGRIRGDRAARSTAPGISHPSDAASARLGTASRRAGSRGEILADNKAMLDFTRHLGFHLDRKADDREIIEARLTLMPPIGRLYKPR